MKKKLLLLTFLLSPTHTIKLQGLGLSIFQIVLILTSIVCLLDLKLPKGKYKTFAFVYGISCFVPYFLSTSSEATSYFLVALMSLILFIIVPSYFNKEDIPLLEKTFIRAQYIVIPLTLVSVYYFYQIGAIPETIHLPGGFYISMDEEASIRGRSGSAIRAMLPYATPPVLSVIMAMSIVLLYYGKNLFRTKIRIFLMIVFTVILIMTASRTGIYGLAMFMFLRLLTQRISARTFAYSILIAFFIFVFSYFSEQIDFFEKFMGKMTEADASSISEDRHLLVPLDGLLLWIDSLSNFLFGIGYGSSLNLKGAHTFLPPHFLNSFVTLIAERGILGLLCVSMLLSMALRLYKKRNKNDESKNGVVYAFITLLFSTLFYETFNTYVIIYFIAVMWVADKDYEISHRIHIPK